MDSRFQAFIDTLHPSFERLLASKPFTTSTIPKGQERSGIYLFTERDVHLYVGRTRQFNQRMGNHARPSAGHNQATFAFQLAREEMGLVRATYTVEGSRTNLCLSEPFASAFLRAKERVRQMDVRFVAEPDPLRQTLLEMYVAVALQTRYNDFNTH